MKWWHERKDKSLQWMILERTMLRLCTGRTLIMKSIRSVNFSVFFRVIVQDETLHVLLLSNIKGKISTLYCATASIEIILDILKKPNRFSLKDSFIMDPAVFTLKMRKAISSPPAYKKAQQQIWSLIICKIYVWNISCIFIGTFQCSRWKQKQHHTNIQLPGGH